MYKNASNKEKYAALQKWLPGILENIKKDLKNEHLRKDFAFVKKYFPSKNLNKITLEEMTEAYEQAIAQTDQGESLGEFITSRWLLNHSELYEFFESELSKISNDFTALEEIELQVAQDLVKKATQQFGSTPTYLFSVLNSVVFPSEVFHQMEKEACCEREMEESKKNEAGVKLDLNASYANHEIEMARMKDKYEKKLSGLQKKYQVDVDNLKKQIAQLQRKLQER